MTLEIARYQAKAIDERGFTIWSDVVEAKGPDEASEEARLEYESYMLDAYEPGHYKAQVMLDAVDRYEVKRLP